MTSRARYLRRILPAASRYSVANRQGRWKLRNGDRTPWAKADRAWSELTSAAKRRGMWSCPNHRRTTWAFLPSTRALSLELRGRGLVNRSTRSFSQQPGDLVVDVLGAVVGVEAEDAEREGQQQALEQRQQEAFGDAVHGADELVLGDLVDEVDQEEPLGAVAVALVDGVDAGVAGQALRIGRLAQGDLDRGRARPGPHGALGAVGRRAAQVVEVAVGERRQALEARIPEHLELAAQDLARGQSPTSGRRPRRRRREAARRRACSACGRAGRGCRRAGRGPRRCRATAAPGARPAGARSPSRRRGSGGPRPCRACRAARRRSDPACPGRSRRPRPGPAVGSPPPRCLRRRPEAARLCEAAASRCPRSSPNGAPDIRFTLTSRWNRLCASPSLRVGQFASWRLRAEDATIGECRRALRDDHGLRVHRSTVSRWLRRHAHGKA